jgi:transcriptional regulator with XRE-family HTH domain
MVGDIMTSPERVPRIALTQFRELRGLTQEQLALVSDRSRSWIAQVESGSYALKYAETREAAAKVYGVSLDVFEALCAGKMTPKRALAVMNHDDHGAARRGKSNTGRARRSASGSAR